MQSYNETGKNKVKNLDLMKTNNRIDNRTDIQAYAWTEKLTDNRTGKHTYNLTDLRADKQTDYRTDKNTDTQTYITA